MAPASKSEARAELIWLASYPKSGNTWFRSILTALNSDRDETPDLNHLLGSMLVGWRGIEEAMGVKSTELSQAQILELRPAYARAWVGQSDSDDPIFIKTHDALGQIANGEPTVPPEETRLALYFVRNPLDVAVSYAHHSGTTASKMVQMLSNDSAEMARPRRRLGHQIPQPTGSWSGHYRSWTTSSPIKVHVTRYEDMIDDPVASVALALAAADLDYSQSAIRRAIELTAFDRLTAKESESGFREKSQVAEKFFRRGKVGSWRAELSAGQVAELVSAHAEVMTELGYLSSGGVLTV